MFLSGLWLKLQFTERNVVGGGASSLHESVTMKILLCNRHDPLLVFIPTGSKENVNELKGNENNPQLS